MCYPLFPLFQKWETELKMFTLEQTRTGGLFAQSFLPTPMDHHVLTKHNSFITGARGGLVCSPQRSGLWVCGQWCHHPGLCKTRSQRRIAGKYCLLKWAGAEAEWGVQSPSAPAPTRATTTNHLLLAQCGRQWSPMQKLYLQKGIIY